MLACVAIFFLTLGIRAALLPWEPVPIPAIHDEMSYLLAGDTYASGRLANPPHAFWETFHVLQQPVYASKYQPLQGLVLAFGEKFFGPPWAGVYLSAGLMCAAMCWMLQGWIEPELALLGAVLFMLRAGIFGYWMNSYWGGAVAAIGGALVLGAVARIWRRKQLGHAATWAVGLAILMHSRPYDAALLGLLSGAVLVWALRKSDISLRTACVRVALPALLILTVSLAAVGYYDYRLTGSATTLPFQLFDKQYVVAPMFSFLPLRPEPVYRHAPMHEFFAVWNVELWKTARHESLNTFLAGVGDLYAFFFGSLIGYQFTSSLSILFNFGTEVSKFGLARVEVIQDLIRNSPAGSWCWYATRRTIACTTNGSRMPPTSTRHRSCGATRWGWRKTAPSSSTIATGRSGCWSRISRRQS